MAYNQRHGAYQDYNDYDNNFSGNNRAGNGGRSFSQGRGSGQQKKHSGAKWVIDKKGNPCISAWNYSRKGGLIKVFIAPYRGSGIRTSKTGRRWDVWMCKIEGKLVAPRHFPVLIDPDGKKAIIKEFGWVVNTKARNGGYCGTFTRRD